MIMYEWDVPEGHSGQFSVHLCIMYPPNFQHLQLAVSLVPEILFVSSSSAVTSH
jgi:hypothetical protein